MVDKTSFKILPLTLGIETQGGLSTPLVLRGTPLPTLRTGIFSTASDNQEGVSIKVCLGQSPLAHEKEVRPYGIHIVDVFYITHGGIIDAPCI